MHSGPVHGGSGVACARNRPMHSRSNTTFYERKKLMEKSNKFLTVTGILMIIGGAIGIILGIAVVACAGVVAGWAAEVGEVELAGTLLLGSIILLVSAVVQFVAGIIGVANAKKPEKAMVCIVFGILTALTAIVGQLINLGNGVAFDILGWILGLALPVLYLIGAFQNKAKAG